MPKNQWDRVPGPVDVVILEGWCLGARAEPEASLARPVNKLEAEEDSDGRWRTFVNRTLAESYPALFAMVDIWVMLRAPGFETVFAWRWEQEQKLANKLQDDNNNSTRPHGGLMSQQEVARFVQFFQRLTERLLDDLPRQVDHCYQLNTQRRIIDEKHRNS